MQERFLDLGGCDYLAAWIDRMPDGTFPNSQVVEGIMHCLECLPINADNLSDSRCLGRLIKSYANGKASKQVP